MNSKRVVYITFQAAVVAVVFFVAAILLAGHFGYVNIVKPYIVQSGSMESVIGVGSVVFSTPAKIYNPGDIVSFAAKGDKKNIITHRIVFKLYPDGVNADPVYVTSGDANEEFDRWEVKDEHIIGKVFLTVPYLGYPADFAKKPQGFILLVVVPATIIIYEELRFLGKELKEKTRGAKLFHPSGGNEAPPVVDKTLSSRKELPKIAVVLPAIGAAIVVISLSAAYFFDLEKSLANILGAATSFGEKTAPLYDSDPYTCPTGATNFTVPQPNVVILEKEGGNIKATVVLDGATLNSTYDIWINQDPGGCPLSAPTEAGAIITDVNGDGTGDASAPEVGGATKFWISAVGGGQVLRSTAVTF